MLTIVVVGHELYDQETNEFKTLGDLSLQLEHSLVSLSKWESKFEKPFLSGKAHSAEEILYYVECMILTKDYPENWFQRLTSTNMDAINAHIESKQSGTTFGQMPERKGRNEVITSELIYYWMVAFNIPFECETWHLNRLFALIRICNLKNSKPQKMGKSEQARQYRELNAKRRSQLGTSG